MEAYRIEQLSFSYPGHTNKVLESITLTIDQGEFVTICGKSGSGKSTLLRQLKPILAPHGEREGSLWFEGERLESIDPKRQASAIGFVLQNPDNQIVTDKVWHELAFGLESLGYDQQTIRLRVAEMASFFGIQGWFHKSVTELSGGQKQMLNLASVMVMQPSVLVLDEPTSMLDPIASHEFLEILYRINRDLGITIILSEHRLEEAVAVSDRLVVLDDGHVIANGSPAFVGNELYKLQHSMFLAMPSAMQITKGIAADSECLVTINEARHWLTSRMADRQLASLKMKSTELTDQRITKQGIMKPILQLKDVWFRYEKTSPDVIKDLSLEVNQGELYCIVGGNGTGKTTALSIMAGLLQPYRGKVILDGADSVKASFAKKQSASKEQENASKQKQSSSLVVLPQNPQNLFVKKSVELDLLDMLPHMDNEQQRTKMDEVIRLTELEGLLERHPYDLSGGEQQRAALAKILLLEPKIILLDEPTKGLDAFFKTKFAAILQQLVVKGVTIVMVSHDIEFCAKYADRCALFFDGGIVTANSTRTFFAGNSFYTTSANRIARQLCAEAVTVEDVIALCR